VVDVPKEKLTKKGKKMVIPVNGAGQIRRKLIDQAKGGKGKKPELRATIIKRALTFLRGLGGGR